MALSYIGYGVKYGFTGMVRSATTSNYRFKEVVGLWGIAAREWENEVNFYRIRGA